MNGVQVIVNGVSTEVAEPATVATLVAAQSGGQSGGQSAGHARVAVALNGDVVPRSSWAATRLSPGDRLEVLAPTAGG